MLEHLHEAIRQSMQEGVDWLTFRQLVQASYFAQAVDLAKGNQCKAARQIRVHRNTMGRETRKSRG
jgi:DNA-binding protein Fis